MRTFYSLPLALFFIIQCGILLAQTNPTAQSLPYNQNFGTSTFTSMPAGMAAWNGLNGATISTQALAEASVPTSDATVTSATAPQTTGGVYGYATSSNARVYIQTSSNTVNGVNQVALAINTTGYTSITVSYDVEIISAQPRTVGIVLQYRVGTSGPWTTVSGSGNPYSQAGGTTGVKVSPSLTLPSDANNQPVVQLRWAVWRGTETGNSSGIAIDNISVTGSSGPSPVISTTGTLSSFSTTYGTPSSSQSYSVSGTDLTTGITITPPVGFQVSTLSDFSDSVGTNSSPLVVGAAGNLPAKTIYVRLSGNVNVGSYSGNISHASTGATTVNVSVPSSTVNTLSITVTGATANNKVYDGNTTATISGGTLVGVLAGDVGDVNIAGGTFSNKNVGTGKTVTINLGGPKAGNYSVSTTLTANITAKELTITGAAAQNKIFDGNADAVVTGTLTGVITPDVVGFTNTGLFDSPSPGLNKPVTFTGTLTGADAANYFLTPPTGLTASIFACPDTIYWAFSVDSSITSSTAGSKVTASVLGRGNNNGTTVLINSTSASTGYAGASGGNNAGAAAFIGGLNTATSTYFEFTLTPESGRTVTLFGISFGSRSTSTGPAAFTIRSSADGYTSNLATGTLSTAGIWQLQTPALTATSSGVGTPITFRIYGHNGSGSPSPGTANWRIDDLRLVMAASPKVFNSTVSACNAYTWPVNSTTYTSSTSVTEVVDCDTFKLNLTINSSSKTTTTVSACSTYTWSVNSVTYTTSIIDTVISGCDTSILNLTITSPLTWYLDADADGWYPSTTTACSSPGAGWTSVLPSGGSGDCNDANAAVNPGATEICGNGIDDDCDGGVDEDCITCTGPPASPGNIIGFSSNVCGGSVYVYSVSPVSGATGYYWTTTGAATVTGGQGTNSATITFASNFTTGSVRVQAYNDCDSSAVRVLSVKSTTLPTPGPISGQVDGVCPGTSHTYTISPVSGATSYAWSVGGGDVTVSGSPTGTSATFNFGPSFTTGVIRVQALNACGGSGFRTLGIRSVPNPPTVINGQLTGVIPGSSGNYSTPAVAGATSYLWEVTGNATINSGATTTTVNVGFAPSFTGGTIRVRSVNACGNSTWRTANITAATPKLAGPSRSLTIFPNPATSKVSIQSEGISSILLYDVSGKVLLARRYQSEYSVELDLNQPAGIYFIEVAGEGWREVRKLVVE